jgi:Deoxyribonuclease II
MNNAVWCLVVLCVYFVPLLEAAVAPLTCKDGNGNSVDWWFARKLPASWQYMCIIAFYFFFIVIIYFKNLFFHFFYGENIWTIMKTWCAHFTNTKT